MLVVSWFSSANLLYRRWVKPSVLNLSCPTTSVLFHFLGFYINCINWFVVNVSFFCTVFIKGYYLYILQGIVLAVINSVYRRCFVFLVKTKDVFFIGLTKGIPITLCHFTNNIFFFVRSVPLSSSHLCPSTGLEVLYGTSNSKKTCFHDYFVTITKLGREVQYGIYN